MKTKKVTADLVINSHDSGNGSTIIVAQDADPVKTNGAGEMIAAIQQIYPGYDKVLHSKVQHGDHYGIRLRADAETLVRKVFDRTPKAERKRERRSKPCRIYARLSEPLFAALLRVTARSGQTIQDYIEAVVTRDLTDRRDTYAEVGEKDAGVRGVLHREPDLPSGNLRSTGKVLTSPEITFTGEIISDRQVIANNHFSPESAVATRDIKSERI